MAGIGQEDTEFLSMLHFVGVGSDKDRPKGGRDRSSACLGGLGPVLALPLCPPCCRFLT